MIDLTKMIPSEFELRCLFSDPRIRPPILGEIMPDCRRLARSMGKQYCDTSCYALQEEEIEGAIMEKLSYLINKNYLLKQRNGKMMTRTNFFRLFASTAKNKACSLVQKHRFTAKRTGFKAPKRDKNGFNEETRKPFEISLDNPDNHVQIAESSGVGEVEGTQLVRDMPKVLNPIEMLVFTQISEPNQEAILLATIDSYRLSEKKRTIVINDTHLAKSLGIETSEFLLIRERVKKKVKKYMDGHEDTNFNVAKKRLCDFFTVQIPPHVEAPVIKRLFTLLAREHHDRLTEEVNKDLITVGALLPEKLADSVGCFGVLFDEKDQSCRRCQVREGCQVKAANHGLGTITLSRSLIRQHRFPVVLATGLESGQEDDEPYIKTERDEIVYNYLCSQFRKTKWKDEGWGFRNRDHDNNTASPLIVLDTSGSFRFCKPNRAMQNILQRYKAAYFLPDVCDADEAIELIDLHAKASLTEAA